MYNAAVSTTHKCFRFLSVFIVTAGITTTVVCRPATVNPIFEEFIGLRSRVQSRALICKLFKEPR